ncbi:MAG: acyl-CoA dehydrogenase family protein [Proteobacteria bacterium]|nr:acyl-CoA dehydrogenase family protein [Pseudomonadota bacterium]
MDFQLDSELVQIQDTVRKFCEKEVTPHAEEWEKNEFFPRETIRKMGGLGFFASPFPEQYGGTELGFLANIIVAEELGRASLGLACCLNMQSGTCPMTLLLNGNEEQKEKFLPGIISGELLGCFAVTEPNAATDVAGIETKAIKDGDHYILNGSKMWITHSSVFDVGICFAKTDPTQRHKGLSAFIIEKGMEGMTGMAEKDKLGVRSSDTGQIVFEDVRVPKENLIGEEGQGFKIAESALTYGRANIAGRSLGIGQAAVDAALKYANEREQFGKKIGFFQMNKQIIADMVAEIDASRLLVYRAAWLQDQKRPSSNESTIAKFYASEAAVRAVIGAAKIHGAYTYSSEYPVARLYRDVMLMTAGEGTSNIQRLIIANNALGWK